MYWDISRPLSYNALFNFIVGARGVGKTYGAKEHVIKNFLKNKSQFVYVRRFSKELAGVDKFFNDIEQAFPGHEFRVKQDKKMTAFLIDGEVAGWALILATAKIAKSVPFPAVTTIIFDEFILDKGYYHYLPDEVTNFLELYSTVARDRDVRVWFISNAITFINPYFIYFNVKMPFGSDIAYKDDILIQNIRDGEYQEHMQQTRFGKMVSGTAYGNYAVCNDYLRDNKQFVAKKKATARYFFTFLFKGKQYGVWRDYVEGYQYVSEDTDPSSAILYAFTVEDHTPNTLLLTGKKPQLVQAFVEAYKLGLTRFESIAIKNMCADLIKLLV